MSVKEEVSAALSELLLPELAEIKKGLADLNAGLNKVIKKVDRIGRPLNDFDHLEDLQEAGMSREKAEALIRAKYEISRAAKANLEEVGLKVESDLNAAGFNPGQAQTIVNLIKDRFAS